MSTSPLTPTLSPKGAREKPRHGAGKATVTTATLAPAIISLSPPRGEGQGEGWQRTTEAAP
ncbi:MAG: hypothetical protein IPM17_01450 [Verrucomicrobia bacterium]|nr:hypothetical protein [Verrucomicrobiota bacterium]